VLRIGDSVIDKISDEVVDGDFLVAVVSPDSVESQWCRHELAVALTQGINEHRVKVLPIRFRSATMPAPLGSLYWGDADAQSVEDLARDVARAMAVDHDPARSPPAVDQHRPHAERPDDATVAGIDGLGKLTLTVVHELERASGGAETQDLRHSRRRLRFELDSLREEVRFALPLVGQLATGELGGGPVVGLDIDVIEADLFAELRAVRTQVAQGLPLVPRWTMGGTHGRVDAGSRDAVAYLWEIDRGREGRNIMVFISRTAMGSSDERPQTRG
jgi:hypothetical protein